MARYSRIIRQITSTKKGPTLVFFGGIHGNEKSGVLALKEVLKSLTKDDISGSIYAISGNLKALEERQRFMDEDLNRIWTPERIEVIVNKTDINTEESELLKLHTLIQSILQKHSGPFYFFDLHTTSSKTLPFITINDALINRSFSKQFPVPIVLGIEEYLEGALLSYINQLGYVSLGFESGQHDDIQAVKNHVAFINLAMVFTGLVKQPFIADYNMYYSQLKQEGKHGIHFFEIIDLHSITKADEFKMCSGFESFQIIHKGDHLATQKQGAITSHYNARIFMPLYQEKGSEGFFIIRSINTLFLRLSIWLRRLKADSLLGVLPGVFWHNKSKGILKVDLKTAKFLAKPIFHLLGYRSKQIDSSHLILYNRERVAKTKMYKGEYWH